MNNEDYISQKLESLLSILGNSVRLNEESKEQRTMIFTDTRFVARLVSEYINKRGIPNRDFLF